MITIMININDFIDCWVLQVDACVFGVGTGGTITGVGTFLREKNPNIKVWKRGSPSLHWSPLPLDGGSWTRRGCFPLWITHWTTQDSGYGEVYREDDYRLIDGMNRHSITGLGAGFRPGVLDTDVYDEIIRVSKKREKRRRIDNWWLL